MKREVLLRLLGALVGVLMSFAFIAAVVTFGLWSAYIVMVYGFHWSTLTAVNVNSWIGGAIIAVLLVFSCISFGDLREWIRYGRR